MEHTLVSTDLRSVGDVFSAVTDETDGLHAGVGERSVAGELRQTFDSVLEGVNGSWEMLLKYIRCEVKRDDKCSQCKSFFTIHQSSLSWLWRYNHDHINI